MSYCDNDMLLPRIFEYIPMLWFLPHLKIQLWGTPCPAKILAILGLQEVLGGWEEPVPQSYWSEDQWDWENEHLPPEVSASLSWRNKWEVSTSFLPSPCGLGTNLSAATCDPAGSCYWAASPMWNWKRDFHSREAPVETEAIATLLEGAIISTQLWFWNDLEEQLVFLKPTLEDNNVFQGHDWLRLLSWASL